MVKISWDLTMKEEYCPVCLPDDNLILVKLRCGHKICQGLKRVIRLSGENMTIEIDPEIDWKQKIQCGPSMTSGVNPYPYIELTRPKTSKRF